MKRIIFSLLAVPSALVAQPVITWQAIDGGSAMSGGGSLRLRGTAGQAEAGTSMRGGNLSLLGGFEVLSTPGAPTLAIERVAGGVRVSWPLSAGPGVLEETDSLDTMPVQWRVANYPIETNGGQVFVTIPIPTGDLAKGQIQIPAKKVIKFRRR